MNYIDIHGHYAWGIDDGIPNIEQAKMALLKASYEHINMIVATAHVNQKTSFEDLRKIVQRIEELKILAQNYHIQVLYGSELMLDHTIEQRMKAHLYLPIENTDYVLCEYNVKHVDHNYFDHFDEYLISLLSRGYKPIVAHIERYYQNHNLDIGFIKYLIEMCCVIQVNSSSLLTNSIYRTNAMRLLDHQLVHVIASDTHRAHKSRYPNLDECYCFLTQCGFDHNYLNILFYDNPKRIIENQNTLQPKCKKRSLIQRCLKK